MPKGRPPAATKTQIDDVRRLAAEGVSRRQIAATVFGDVRYHGRVDRILRQPERRLQGDHDGESPAPESASETLRWLRQVLDRHRERLAKEDLPPLNEIKLFMEAERRLEAAEMVERANALTRDARD